MELFKETRDQAWFAFPGTDESYKLGWIAPEDAQAINKDKDVFMDILLDWKGVDGNGKPVECNEKNKLAFFKTSDGRLRYEWMIQIAMNPRSFETNEDILKNLKAPFGGAISIPTPTSNGAMNANKVVA